MGRLKKILDRELFKVTSLNSISVLIKICIGFITSKVLAIFVGPTGLALVGNLRNFITSIENVSTLGFQNGIIKYVAEYENEQQNLKVFLSTVLISILVVTLLLSCSLYFFADYLNHEIFGKNYKYQSVFEAFALCLPWYIASLILITIINGFGEFKKIIKINIYGNILGLILSVTLMYYYHEFGALLSVIAAPTGLFFITLSYVNLKIPFIGVSSNFFDFSIIKSLSEYSLMALVSSVFGPMVYFLIRNNIIQRLGYNKAGYWEAISRISSYYLLFLTTVLTVYFLPKLSKSIDDESTKKIFWSYYKGIFPFFAVGLIILYGLKDILIPIILTKEFQPIRALFFWQIVGDLFKALSLILGYHFFAKKLTRAFIITEIFSLLILWLSSNFFLKIFGIEGIVMAYAFTYFNYMIVLTIYFRKSIF